MHVFCYKRPKHTHAEELVIAYLQLRLRWRFVVLYLAALCGTEVGAGTSTVDKDPRLPDKLCVPGCPSTPIPLPWFSQSPYCLACCPLVPYPQVSFTHCWRVGDKGGKTWSWGTTAMQIGREALRFQDTAPELLAPIRLTSHTHFIPTSPAQLSVFPPHCTWPYPHHGLHTV